MSTLNRQNPINWTDEEIEYLRNYFHNIKSFLNKPISYPNFALLYHQCFSLLSVLPISTIEIHEKRITRARKNESDESGTTLQLFTKESEISYNKENPELIGWGRFHCPGEPMFYGALPTSGDKANFLATASFESYKELQDHENSNSHFDLTIGAWNVEPFMAVCLCFDDRHVVSNDRMRQNIQYFKNDIYENCGERSAKFILDCLSYFSELSSSKCTDNKIYFVLSAFFCALREVYKFSNVSINGVVFPSSTTDAKGLNIALTSNAVDTFLKLEEVMMYRFQRHVADKFQYDGFPITEVVEVKNHAFKFTHFFDSRYGTHHPFS